MPYVWTRFRNVWNGRNSWGADEIFIPSEQIPALENKGDIVFETAGNNASTALLFTMPALRQMRAGGVARQQHRSCGCGKADEKELDYMGVNR